MAKIVAFISMGSSPDGNLHVAIVELKTFNKGVLIELQFLYSAKKVNLIKYITYVNIILGR